MHTILISITGCAGNKIESEDKNILETSEKRAENVIISNEKLKNIKNQGREPASDYESIIEAIENGADPTEEFEATANGGMNDKVEIVWDKVTYYIPCPFFKSNKLFELKKLKNENKPVYFVNDAKILMELDRHKKYTDNFNKEILRCSSPDVKKGKIKDEKATIIREEMATTVNADCYKYTYTFDKSIFYSSKESMSEKSIELYESGIGLIKKYNKEKVNKILQEFADYKKKYNKDKFEGNPSNCKN